MRRERPRRRPRQKPGTFYADPSKHLSAMVKAIVEGTIKWEKDPDFGYLVATEVPGIDAPDYLQPKKMYERQGRLEECNARGGEVQRPIDGRICGSGRDLATRL